MEEELKKASWLELFYDVAFVALVARLTYLAYEYHHTISDFLHIFIVGYTIFIAWWATTANRNLNPEERATDKVFTQIQMVGAFVMSLTMGAVFEGSYMNFFIAFGALRLFQSLMVLRMYFIYPETRPHTYNMIEGFFTASVLWVSTAFIPDPFHFVIAGMALTVDIFTPLTRGKGNTKRYLNVYHLQERLGLFLMLVIGESMIVVALANTAASSYYEAPSVVFSGIGMMIALWWLYFEYADEKQGIRPKNLFLFLHAHGFLFGSIILASVGYKLALSYPESAIAASLVVAGAVGILVTLMVIRWAMNAHLKKILSVGIPFLSALTTGSVYLILEGKPVVAIIFCTAVYIGAVVIERKLMFNASGQKIS